MKIRASQSKSAAFTIIEIAIALGIIGFALVAIVGILPTGLNVERENREETLINQDGPYFLEAVRSGTLGLGTLTNFVDSITIRERGITGETNTVYDASGTMTSSGGTNYNGHMTNVDWIIGLMSRPKYLPLHTMNAFGLGVTNRIDVKVRALSGSAIEQTNTFKDMAFAYSIYAEIVPVNFHSFQGDALGNNPGFDLSKDAVSENLQANLYEVRLNFRWPLLPNGAIGNGRKVFRTFVSGRLVPKASPDSTTDLYHFYPDNFAKLQ